MLIAEARLHQVFVLNLVLQLFDGIATWQGVHVWGEGNPVLELVMASVGVGIAVLLAKVFASAFLVMLRRCWRYREAYAALIVVATFYTAFSFVPWMLCLVSLLEA
jgi:hypothetical protein